MNINTARQILSICDEAMLWMDNGSVLCYKNGDGNIELCRNHFVLSREKRRIRLGYGKIKAIEVIS